MLMSFSPVTVMFRIVEDDMPLPKIPRAGMGDVFPMPPESDLRSEAMYIIESTKRLREQQEKDEAERKARR